MATLNLGRIKPVFRGAYAGGTAYVVDDIVTSGNETFICILASTGNATSNATYWTKLAAKGTDGTDVGTTITTQGDILYRDGSGLQRLAKGTASQQLRMNSGATAPEWATIDAGTWTQIIDTNCDTVTYLDLQDVFSADYRVYKMYLTGMQLANTTQKFAMRMLSGSGSTTLETGSDYNDTSMFGYIDYNGSQGHSHIGHYNGNMWRVGYDVSTAGVWRSNYELVFWQPYQTSHYKHISGIATHNENNQNIDLIGTWGGKLKNHTAYTGVRLFGEDLNTDDMTIDNVQLFGLKNS